MCGKNRTLGFAIDLNQGSPPRVREKLAKIAPLSVNGGITPACAGKTELRLSVASWAEDHPRVCGKNKFQRSDISFRLGSPPRVREKLVSCGSNSSVLGITPACAGKTLGYQGCIHLSQDHPRVCGKNEFYSRKGSSYVGSPPRVREKRSLKGLAVDTCGITPACAGKTNCVRIRSVRSRDHPRVCGKNILTLRLPF